MFGKKRPQVLVVGAGPVGLFAAIGLVKRGVEVQIVDKEWRTGTHSYALALHGQSLRLLEQFGLLPQIEQNAYRIDRVAFHDAQSRRAELCLEPILKLPQRPSAAEELPSHGRLQDRLSIAPPPGSLSLAVLRQDVLEQLLEDTLKHLGVSVHWNHEVAHLAPGDDGVTVTINRLQKNSVGYASAHTEWVVAKRLELQVPFVIGADGYRSTVRQSLGIDFPAFGGAHDFAVFEFTADVDLEHEMRVVLGEQTTDVLWPMPQGHCRWGFELTGFDGPVAARDKDRFAVELAGVHYPILAEEYLETLIGSRAPWFEGEIHEIVWRTMVRFEPRLAEAFGTGCVWLAGDAAHTTGPVGMQSMNVGLREADDLALIIAGILRGGESTDWLQAYNRDRLAEWRFLLGKEGLLEAEHHADPWVRERLARLLPCLPASGAELTGLVQQWGLVPA